MTGSAIQQHCTYSEPAYIAASNPTSEPKSMRLFVGLPLPESVQKACGNVISVLREVKGVRGTFPKPTNLHITLAFLGEVEPTLLPDLKAALKEVVATATPQPALVLEQLGAFPSLRKPRTVYVGGIPDPALPDLVSRIRDACQTAGLECDDKAFVAHVTVMRIRDLFDERSLLSGLQRINYVPQSVPVRDIVLYQSELLPSGPLYTPLGHWTIDG